MFSSDSDSEVTVLIVAMATASVVMATSGQAIARDPRKRGKRRTVCYYDVFFMAIFTLKCWPRHA